MTKAVFMKKMQPADQPSGAMYSPSIVNYSDGDVSIFDHVKDLSQLFPLKHMTNLVGICVAGSLTMQVGEKQIKINTNDVFFCTPNDRIENIQHSADFECKMLCLSDNIIQGLLHDKINIWHNAIYINHLNVFSMSSICREEFGFYYGLIRSKIQNIKNTTDEIIKAIVRALLLELCHYLGKLETVRDTPSNLSQGRLLFNKFLNMVSNNEVKRQPIHTYAGKLAITPKYLTMLCLKYSNKTASDWIIEYTLEDIRFYLRHSNLSIKEVSAKLGFANMSHFGSYTRKHLGLSPRDYRYMK